MSWRDASRNFKPGGGGGGRPRHQAPAPRAATESSSSTSSSTRVKSVHIEGLALLNIVKHSSELPPEMAGGSLLGMVVDDRVEVTYAFPGPQEEVPEYEDQMMKALREVGCPSSRLFCLLLFCGEYLPSLNLTRIHVA